MGGPNSRASPDGTEALPPTPCYRDWALRLLEMGYEPLPIKPCSKAPAPSCWTTVPIDAAQVEAWSRQYPDHGIGLRTGLLVAIDIDTLDPDRAHGLQALAFARFGPTLTRVGQWPKRLLLYRTENPFPKMGLPQLDILARGQQLVAFGIHPKTGQAYQWPLGETPLDVGFDDLPLVDQAGIEAYLAEAAAVLPPEETGSRQGSRTAKSSITGSAAIRDAAGMVIDHRDSWLSSIAYHVVWDALDAGEAVDATGLADRVWTRFEETADLSRGKEDGRRPYGPTDAVRKVQDKLRLAARGHLPTRALPFAEPAIVDPGLPVDEARAKLDAVLAKACGRIAHWHEAGAEGAPPRIGLKASVGLGKTAKSRQHLLELQARLRAQGLPDRILVFTPSLALADESAADWQREGLRVAVHRGYEAKMPGADQAMCRDLPMVRMAIAAGQSIFPNACIRKSGPSCHNFDFCVKQVNRKAVQDADVVIAAYDSLFTGLPVHADEVALLVIDEGCWARAIKITRGLFIGTLAMVDLPLDPRMEDPAQEEEAWAQLFALRQQAAQALAANGSGALARHHLVGAGLNEHACDTAIALETLLRADPGLRPGLPQAARRKALELSREARQSINREALFHAMAELLHGEAEQDGRIRILPPDPETGAQEIVVTGLHALHDDLASKPILHLDATLRPELASGILPGLEVVEITAAMPHMVLALVAGRFGKSRLVEDPKASRAENQRRAGHLLDCVDYVRWQVQRVAPGRVLVVSYQAIEPAFASIPGVATGHFNAIAGLDIYKDVALLIVIGRPLPSAVDLNPMAGAFFRQESLGTYGWALRAVQMRKGGMQPVRVMQHEDAQADVLRAAICDDEVIQAIGRGRGVNRTADNPLEVQVLADVALPLIHDRVVSWDAILPDILQRMLLAGMAVDSPTDAAVLHPELFSSEAAAESTLRREGFNRHSPIGIIYRGMTVKYSRYRRGGPGRGWQTAYWLDGDADAARATLESTLGPLMGWKPAASA
jgi:Bifunctional DNA primase/polymerase, N-terminal